MFLPPHSGTYLAVGGPDMTKPSTVVRLIREIIGSKCFSFQTDVYFVYE